MWKKILQSRVVAGLSIVSLGLVLGGWIWLEVALRTARNTPLILHFDDLSGITSVGSIASLRFMGIMGVTIAVMNGLLALEFDSRDRYLGKLIAAVTMVFSALLFISFSAIINVN